ncbi:MAG: cysteine peptidase family C39 domain-containing protein [Campylobacteraceae bacterium]|nr:cysteine peptidase family C39 domain-containing protein [Campylobacteraceae bacterium]
MKTIFLAFLLICNSYANFAVKSYQEIKNARTIRQNYEASCGAASMATILNLIDKQNFAEMDMIKVLSKKELHTDMVSFADLEDALKSLNYEAKSYKIDRDILEHLKTPILVKIEDDPRFPHFVVLINYDGDYLVILDPSHGEYIASKSQFYSLWDRDKNGGYALLIKPKLEFKREKINFPNKIFFEKF